MGVTSPPRFDIKGLRSLADGDPEALLELSAISIASCEQFKQDFQRALESGSEEEFEFHAHKAKMTVDLLHAHVLRAALQHARELVEGREHDAARIQAAIHAIHRELDAIIAALEKAVA